MGQCLAWRQVGKSEGDLEGACRGAGQRVQGSVLAAVQLWASIWNQGASGSAPNAGDNVTNSQSTITGGFSILVSVAGLLPTSHVFT